MGAVQMSKVKPSPWYGLQQTTVSDNHWLARSRITHCQVLSFVTTGAGCGIYTNYNYTINDILPHERISLIVRAPPARAQRKTLD